MDYINVRPIKSMLSRKAEKGIAETMLEQKERERVIFHRPFRSVDFEILNRSFLESCGCFSVKREQPRATLPNLIS